jgi:hypothetical protein
MHHFSSQWHSLTPSISLPPALSSKPSQAKVLTGGRDLGEAQVNIPLSVSHFCV